jgi:hypothetical protein
VQQHLPLPGTTIRERTVGEVLEVLIATDDRPKSRSAAKKKATKSAVKKKPAKKTRGVATRKPRR